jgi:pantothenate kinase
MLAKNVGHEKTEQEKIVGHNNETMKLVNNVGHNTAKKKLVKNSHFEAMEGPQLHSSFFFGFLWLLSELMSYLQLNWCTVGLFEAVTYKVIY